MCVTSIMGVMNTAVRPKTLMLAGNDVLKPQGAMGNTFGVPIESVEVIESGAGGVSSMTFDIDDPNIAIVVNDGDEVRFFDQTNNVPIFSGWVQHWSYEPAFGFQGRVVHIQCVGWDVLLDWAVTTVALTFPGNPTPTNTAAAVQAVVANLAGMNGPIRAFNATPSLSSQAIPTGDLYAGASITTNSVTIPVGTTLREACRLIFAETMAFTFGTLVGNVAIDMYGGLRTYILSDTGRQPSDWTRLTVVDTIAGAIKTEDLTHETDASGIVRAVYVQGGNAAGSGLVSDGTGKAGQIAVLSDSTILTATARDAAGIQYLSQFAVGVRGDFSLTDHSPTFTVHGGGTVRITDSNVGTSATDYAIGSIRKTFQPVRQTWAIEFGGQAPSAVKQIRRLTRSTLS